MPRLAPVCFLVALAVGTAAAQAPAAPDRFTTTAPQGPDVRVTEAEGALTIEVTGTWRTPLSDALARSGGQPDALAVLAAAGQPEVSRPVDLGAAVPPAVSVVAFEGEEVALSAAQAEAFGALAGPAAEVVDVGEHRRQIVGSLRVRLLRVEDGRLIRARRVVVRVPRPALRASLAAPADRNAHLAVDRSALADGRWYRVEVPASGVYRITAAWLRDSLGVEGPDLGRVQVYGNGGRILPALNAAPRPADLKKVPVLARDGELLFWAEGPSWWDWVPGERGEPGHWAHSISPFYRAARYFVRVDEPTPLRLGAGAFPDWPDAERLAAVEDRHFYEEDFYNIERDDSGSGLQWLGPLLGSGGVTELDTVPPGLAAASGVRYRARVAARSNPRATITMARGAEVLDTARPSAVNLSSGNFGNLASDAVLSAETGPGASLAVTFRSSGGGGSSQSWLDWVEAVALRPAVGGAAGYLPFPTPGGRAGRFEVALDGFGGAPEVWDVTVPWEVRRLGVRVEGGAARVQVEAVDTLRARELVAFDPSGPSVRDLGAGVEVPNQNLHGLADHPDYVVVTHRAFEAQARRLAEHRAATDGLRPLVVTTEQVYNEFASGNPDMRAVRDFMKFLYDRAPTAAELPRYLLLFGDGHFNYRLLPNLAARDPGPPDPWFVTTYQTENMVSRTFSYTSDDYYGLMGDSEGRWEEDRSGGQRVDLAVGRFPVRTPQEAATVVDKVLRYEGPETRGDWRTRFTFVGDDQFPNAWDDDLHVFNADVPAQLAQAVDPTVTLDKIYGPAYPLVVGARGRQRPQMTQAIREGIERGTLVWNYSGHGSPTRLGDEDYVTDDLVASLDNPDRLSVWVTATCSFGKFDMDHEQSLAERVLLRAGGGSVAMLTTVRLVYTGSNPDGGNNFGLNLELTEQMLTRDADGLPPRLGDALLRTKNTTRGASLNNRKFNLLGDPGMRLGLPRRDVAVEAPPALRAFEEATVAGQVLGPDGAPDVTYRGTVDVTVFDAQRVVGLAEGACCFTDDDDDGRGEYADRTDRIYAGRASVEGGRFETTFLVPQDVSYSGERARVVAYAVGEDGSDGAGQSTEPVVSPEAGVRPDDGAGPEIRLFVNDTTFVEGGTVGRSPVLVARLSDPSGINTVGAGVGHELLLTIDGDEANATDVGRFYTGDVDTYRSGRLRVPLPDLAPGEHTATLTAWDALNNSSTATVTFVVVDEGLAVEDVLPYPNPTAGPTRFTFNHNQPPGTEARLQLRVYTVAGRPVRTIAGEEALPGGTLATRTVQIPWDGRDDDGDRLATGVYLFHLRVDVPNRAGGREVVERVERLAIIR
jgi:hypothetical protein